MELDWALRDVQCECAPRDARTVDIALPADVVDRCMDDVNLASLSTLVGVLQLVNEDNKSGGRELDHHFGEEGVHATFVSPAGETYEIPPQLRDCIADVETWAKPLDVVVYDPACMLLNGERVRVRRVFVVHIRGFK